MRNFEILPENIILENENKILSRRELEILILIAAGFENIHLAKLFRVTLSTIKKHLEATYLKLNAKNRANAVFIAQNHKLFSQQEYLLVINAPEVLKFKSKCKKWAKFCSQLEIKNLPEEV